MIRARTPRRIAQQNVALYVLPSGTMNTIDGDLTLGTALDAQPTGTIRVYVAASAGLSAGNLYATFSSTTACQLWTDAAATTKPVTVAGAYTGATGSVTLDTYTIPAGAMGANGKVEIFTMWNCNNDATAKTAGVTFGGSTICTLTITSLAACVDQRTILNRAHTGRQVVNPAGATSYGTTTVHPQKFAIDTTAAVTVTIVCNKAGADDYIGLHATFIDLFPQG